MSTKYETQAEIRRVLVRNWLDLDGLSFSVHKETARITGVLRPSGGRPVLVDAAFLDQLESEICRIREVRRVHFDLRNWRRDASGAWRCLEEAKREASTEAGSEEARIGADGMLVLPVLTA